MSERPYFITADAIGSKPVEFFSLEKQRSNLIIAGDIDLKDIVKNVLDEVPAYLPIASEVLNISNDIMDYVLAPVISMPSDLPNRNQQAFPFTELTRWQPDHGCVMYQTWKGKSTFLEHDNKDISKSKGIILSSMLLPIEGTDGDIWKVIKLLAFDRKVDPILAENILSGKANSYSMGAYARDYSCSICGDMLSKGGCDHINYGKPKFQLFAGKLAYYNVVDPIGFECSSVMSPAYWSAKDMTHFTLTK